VPSNLNLRPRYLTMDELSESNPTSASSKAGRAGVCFDMSSKYWYFDIRGRDQPRIVLCAAGADFEDSRPTFATWGEMKQKFSPYSSPSLPAFEDAEVGLLSESSSIVRYLGRKFKLDGTTEKEKVHVDIIVTQMIDLRETLLSYCIAQGEYGKGKGSEREKYASDTLPGTMETYEKLLARNNGGAGYFVGAGLTIADLLVFDIIHTMARSLDKNALAKTPLLEAHRQRLAALPGVQKWIATRPKTNMPPLPFCVYLAKEDECVQD